MTARTRSLAAAPAKAAHTGTTPLVALIDGPLVNQWFTPEDWQKRLKSARYMVERGQRPGLCLRYRETRGEVSHPTRDDLVGRAWTAAPS